MAKKFTEIDEKYLDKLLEEIMDSSDLSSNQFERLVKKTSSVLNITKQKLKYADITLQNEKLKVSSQTATNKVDDLLG